MFVLKEIVLEIQNSKGNHAQSKNPLHRKLNAKRIHSTHEIDVAFAISDVFRGEFFARWSNDPFPSHFPLR